MNNNRTWTIEGKKYISENDFCEQFICTKSEMRRFVHMGMPHHKTETGTKLWFDVKKCQAWFRGEEKEKRALLCGNRVRLRHK